MKKLLALSAGLVVGSALLAAPAQAQVYSQNAVGYIKIEVPANKFVLASMPFYKVSANGEGLTIGEALGTQLRSGSSSLNADAIIKYDPTAEQYRTYFRSSSNEVWVASTNVNVETTTTIMPGEGFWIRSNTASNQVVYLMGEVPMGPSTDVLVELGFQFLSYPYPVEKDINDLDLNSGKAGSSSLNSDTIIKFDTFAGASGAYKTFYLNENTLKWHSSTNAAVPAVEPMKPGEGFWYRSTQAAPIEWTETKPYSYP